MSKLLPGQAATDGAAWKSELHLQCGEVLHIKNSQCCHQLVQQHLRLAFQHDTFFQHDTSCGAAGALHRQQMPQDASHFTKAYHGIAHHWAQHNSHTCLAAKQWQHQWLPGSAVPMHVRAVQL